jgi:ATP-dependent Clp protease ATP-binding subunit ClpC
VRIEEPSEEETVTILKGLSARFEDYHKVLIPEEVLEEIAKLSQRYINDRFLPAKAIDLMDEACARKRMGVLKGEKDFTQDYKKINDLG